MTDYESRLLDVIELLTGMIKKEQVQVGTSWYEWQKSIEPPVQESATSPQPSPKWLAQQLEITTSLLNQMLTHSPGGPEPMFVVSKGVGNGPATFKPTRDWDRLRQEVHSFLAEHFRR